EQDGLFTERRKQFAIFLPTLHTGSEISLVASAGDVGTLLSDALGDTLEGALDDIVQNGLLEGIVEHGPRKQLSFGMAWGRGEIELGRQATGNLSMESANHLIPFAALVVGVVGFVVQNGQRATAGLETGGEILDFEPLGRGFRAKHGGHHVGLVVLGLGSVVKLLNVREV